MAIPVPPSTKGKRLCVAQVTYDIAELVLDLNKELSEEAQRPSHGFLWQPTIDSTEKSENGF